ncbi:hypothetical protein PCANC_01112 [Puccinia coronata f. sp. avenae]|uniref:Uncharacterized protein n=1 Tax=Puccinia coronata f. sp. avenae TaxID=200324 RepID=A0A2N5W5R2_9BASI|nr:hypothetical protein PCASD_03122 [Puccinia coronata f. sp. avenae]PLW57562.1 hypothetical protein PCANC_01112 [Puccinia coronata f. sp. avenae]
MVCDDYSDVAYTRTQHPTPPEVTPPAYDLDSLLMKPLWQQLYLCKPSNNPSSTQRVTSSSMAVTIRIVEEGA